MDKRLFLSVCITPLLVACSSLSRKPLSNASPSQSYPNHATQRQDIVMQAIAMLDRSYTYGGKKLHTGFDCSGLVTFVYKQSAGLALKGSAAQMAEATRSIDAPQAHPGDLVFFNTLGPSFSHVGIFIGDGKFVHAANERTGVKTERLSNGYWSKRFEGYRTFFA
ncbi:C40 family peptidase [Limnohabitans sp.]|uniref:C40 family peptidase n=1 Tax=Limnohabitans sp. TaxID=1907725 RepID=UPI00286EE73B|nr:C40 family peptidase [Limnohabitans sp.]